MLKEDFITKLKQSGLTGRGGAGFPTWQKWQAIQDASGNKKYIICNASEGEPFVLKDKYILENYPQELIQGIKIALSTILHSQAIIYLNSTYYQLFKTTLEKLIISSPIILFQESAGYLGGEETTLLNVIEGKRLEPRIKPPFPTESGLWGQPTLINNVETFYWVAKIAQNQYTNKRFYCIFGDANHQGTFELPNDYSLKQILKETNNYPDFPFFLQVGGGASGSIIMPNELDQPLSGAGSIIIFNKETTNILDLMKGWAEFFLRENCDQCVPCREGVYHINEILQAKLKKPSTASKATSSLLDPTLLKDILTSLAKTSFCPLGKGVAIPFTTALRKLF
ncbi:MAG: hypothetical protein NTV62_00240 [Candidatus Gribaldobacteria bacterium]|nr:hypothetical protein [Candidatus Gribaldobacteria bacterium]